MAELDFSRRVGAPQAGESLPKPIGRSVTAEVTGMPDVQQAVNTYAANSNWMSALGSEIATKSSNAIAAKLGSEMGKNPQGELGPTFTDFDKNLKESYDTQAQSTLSLQAQKLITDSNIELSTATRLTPEMIAKKQGQVNQGLQKIYSYAPEKIRPSLEHQYGSLMMQQNSQLVERMVREQREDMSQNVAAGARVHNQNAYTFALNGVGLDKNGDSVPGLEAVHATEKAYDSAVANKLPGISPVQAQIAKDSVRQSYQSGKITRQAIEAEKNGKLPEFYRNLVDNPPSDLKTSDRIAVYNNVAEAMNQRQALRTQDEQLRLTKFNEVIAKNPVSADIPAQLEDLRSNVSPVAYEKAQLAYIQARKAWEKSKADTQDLTPHWGDADAFAHATEKKINDTYDSLVNTVMQKDKKSKDEAEVLVAASAGGEVPVFTKMINEKLTGGNPQSIISASQQIQELRDMEAGHALNKITPQAKAIALQFQHQRGSMPDADLARKVTDNIINLDSSMQTTLDNQWSLILQKNSAGGLYKSTSLGDFALDSVGIKSSSLGGKYFQTIYGNDIYDQLKSNFDAARGDFETAKKMTKDYVDQRYGETRVNGSIQTSDSPIEKALGYKDPDVVPFIQQDLLNQMNKSFEAHKEKNDYWEITPVKTDQSGLRTTLRKQFPPAEIIRTITTDKGVQKFRYPINLIGRPGGEWDIVVVTPTARHNIFLVAPQLGIMTYKPNAEEIRKNYQEYINKKGWF